MSLVNQRDANSGTVHYYGVEGHGSVRFLTDTNGAITDTYAYDSYGNLIASSGTTTNVYLYCCYQYDSDVGMYYLNARYYQPNTGRFWTSDTYEGDQKDPLSLHKYLYGADNPINRIDPSGHDDIGDFLDSFLDSIGFSFSIGQLLTPLAAELDDHATQVLWAETGSVYPGLKQGSTKSSYENWD